MLYTLAGQAFEEVSALYVRLLCTLYIYALYVCVLADSRVEGEDCRVGVVLNVAAARRSDGGGDSGRHWHRPRTFGLWRSGQVFL